MIDAADGDLVSLVEREPLSGWRLITGITGFLGRYLLCEALQRRENVAVLVRNRRGMSAADRVDQIVSDWERRHGATVARPVVLAGDLSSNGLGLSNADGEWFRHHVESVVHSAASVCFQATSRGEPMNSNVHGTQRLLDICRDSRISEFHYVSTAYSCGHVNRLVPVLEELHSADGPFGNIYEDSKCQAEHLVINAEGSFSRTIFRPSIVIGEAESGYSSSFNTIYTPLRLAWMLYKESLTSPPTESELLNELGLDGEEARNIVPVDWVTQMIGAMTRDPSCHGRIYHLTNPRPTPGREILVAINRALSASPEITNQSSSFGTKANTELADFNAHMEAYRSYFVSDPIFDNSRFREQAVAVPCPIVDVEVLTRTFQYAVSKRFKTDFSEVFPVDLPKISHQFESVRQLTASEERSSERSLRVVNGHDASGDVLPQASIGTSQTGSVTAIRMTLTGPGGGMWQVGASPNGIQIEAAGRCDELIHFYGSAKAFRAWLKCDASLEDGLRSGAFVLIGNSSQLPEVAQLMGELRRQVILAENQEPMKVDSSKQSEHNLSVGNAAC